LADDPDVWSSSLRPSQVPISDCVFDDVDNGTAYDPCYDDDTHETYAPYMEGPTYDPSCVSTSSYDPLAASSSTSCNPVMFQIM